MKPPVSLNDILRTVNRLRTVMDMLRKREAGSMEGPASGFPHRVRLHSFRPGDEIVVVASGWIEEDGTRPVTLQTRLTHEGEAHVLTLVPYGPDGERISGEALVHASWIASV